MAEAKKSVKAEKTTAKKTTVKTPEKVPEAKKSAKVKKSAVKETKPKKDIQDGTTKKSNQTPVQADKEPEVEKSVDSAQSTTETPEVEPTPDTKTVAKAGKRSAKALKEVEEKQAKASRKEAQSSEASSEGAKNTPKQKQRTAEERLKRRGKNYRKALEQIDKTKQYTVSDGLKLAVQSSKVKFDATVELHIRLAVDPKQADQNVRDTVVLPAGTGKDVRVAVFAAPDDVEKAKKAGADIAGADEFLQQLDKGELNFDVLISSPANMAKLGKYARVLGPKGLMPNPKSGTVSTDVAKAVKEAKAGRVEYRVDSTGIVHVGIGKVSFGAEKLMDNAKAVISSIKGNKPASVKGTYVQSVFTASSMGPSICIDISDVNNL